MDFWIDIEDSSGNRLGSGPIITATAWQSDPALSQAGTFSFSMPASDPQAALIQSRRVVRCYMPSEDGPVEIGAGIIESIGTSADAAGNLMLQVAGDDLLRELARRQVGDLTIDDGSGGATSTGPTLVMAYAPTGWTLSGSSAVSILHQFEGESVLNALIRIAEMTGESFRLGTGRQIVWLTSTVTSDVHLFYGLGVPNAENTGAVLSITEDEDSYDAVTRIYPYGVGNGDQRVTLSAATWSAPTGYQISTSSNYIRTTAETSTTRSEIYMSFKDISDANTLAEAAYQYLSQHKDVAKFYSVECLLAERLQPGDSVHLVARRVIDNYQALDVDDDLEILAAGVRIDANGLRTTSLQLATVPRQCESDAQALLATTTAARDAYTHTQPVDVEGHHSTHEDGGSDEIDVGGLSGTLAEAQKITVQKAGTTIGTRKTINIVSGADVTDNASSDRVDIEIGATAIDIDIDLLDVDGVTEHNLVFTNGILTGHTAS